MSLKNKRTTMIRKVDRNYWEYVVFLSIGSYPDTSNFDLSLNTQWLWLVDKIPTPITWSLLNSWTDFQVEINSLVNNNPTLNVTINGLWEWWALFEWIDTNGIPHLVKLYIREQ